MTDYYQVLGLEPGSSEEQIRRAYLELVRRHPPERDPQRFVAIREAYERLRDPVMRLQTQLFDIRTQDSIDAILEESQRRLRQSRIPLDVLLSLAEQ